MPGASSGMAIPSNEIESSSSDEICAQKTINTSFLEYPLRIRELRDASLKLPADVWFTCMSNRRIFGSNFFYDPQLFFLRGRKKQTVPLVILTIKCGNWGIIIEILAKGIIFCRMKGSRIGTLNVGGIAVPLPNACELFYAEQRFTPSWFFARDSWKSMSTRRIRETFKSSRWCASIVVLIRMSRYPCRLCILHENRTPPKTNVTNTRRSR